MAKRLWQVTVTDKFGDSVTFKVLAKDDVAARASAIPLYIKQTNLINDRNFKADKATDDLGPKTAYRHITEKDIVYCETELLHEW